MVGIGSSGDSVLVTHFDDQGIEAYRLAKPVQGGIANAEDLSLSVDSILAHSLVWS
jgi:hypothetical protein